MSGPENVDWIQAAECRGKDPNIFFPKDRPNHYVDQVTEAAIILCAACKVKDKCLEYALSNSDLRGTWAATTERDRRQIRRRRRAALG